MAIILYPTKGISNTYKVTIGHATPVLYTAKSLIFNKVALFAVPKAHDLSTNRNSQN